MPLQHVLVPCPVGGKHRVHDELSAEALKVLAFFALLNRSWTDCNGWHAHPHPVPSPTCTQGAFPYMWTTSQQAVYFPCSCSLIPPICWKACLLKLFINICSCWYYWIKHLDERQWEAGLVVSVISYRTDWTYPLITTPRFQSANCYTHFLTENEHSKWVISPIGVHSSKAFLVIWLKRIKWSKCP